MGGPKRRLLALGLAGAAVFFALAPRSPVTSLLEAHGTSPAVISVVAEAAGLAGIAFLLLAFSRVEVRRVRGEPWISVSVPAWLVLGVAGAILFGVLHRLAVSLVGGGPGSYALAGLMLFPIALAAGALISRASARREPARILVITARPGGEERRDR